MPVTCEGRCKQPEDRRAILRSTDEKRSSRATRSFGSVIRWSKTLFRVQAIFLAPRDYVYTWLTDFTSRDALITGEKYRRRIVERSTSRVVFEDLATTPAGWSWLRNVVSLQPPDRWHLEAVGNVIDARADYLLISRGAERTELVMAWRMRPGILGGKVPPKPAIEASLRRVWQVYAAALKDDYRSTRRHKPKALSRSRQS